ncbi:MAG: hypothetical protein E6F97_03830 [Actinobacteria bacterium]|nr:MAG: hypothetical protein E6F97_03830 [Actinomycetota bacterium]
MKAELRRIAEAAVGHAGDGEELAGIVPAEPSEGARVYLCAYRDGEATTWLVLDADGAPVEDRSLVRGAISIAALWELANELRGDEPDGTEVASPALLDRAAADAEDPAAYVQAIAQAAGTVDELVRDVERGYKRPLS